MSMAGIELARRALAAHQVRISVISHNVANAATEGYSRQRTTLAPLDATLSAGNTRWVGGGVEVAAVERQRDEFVDALIRFEEGRDGRWAETTEGLARLESIMQEPSGAGLSDALTEFWGAWRQLSSLPDSEAARVTVRETAHALVNRFQDIDRQLVGYRTELASRVDSTVAQVNTIADRIARLNEQVTRAEARGQSSAALADQRDMLIDDLAELSGATRSALADGTVRVLVEGRPLVDGNRAHPLEVQPDGSGGRLLTWNGSALPRGTPGGRLQGVLELIDVQVPELRERTSTLAEALVEEVNSTHGDGYGLDGSHLVDFFTVTGATFSLAGLELNPVFETNLEQLAAAQAGGGAGDGRNALELANLASKAMNFLSSTDPMEYHRQTLAELGVASATAEQLRENQQVIVQDLRDKRNAIAGVSMDEELTQLVEAEHAYQAAAKLVRTMDSLLATIINELGGAGR